MAEAHSAVAFSFHITHEGVHVRYDQELLHQIWLSVKRSYKRRIGRFKNNFMSGIYPATPTSLLFVMSFITGMTLIRKDTSLGIIPWAHQRIFGTGGIALFFTAAAFSLIFWILIIQFFRNTLKILLFYKGWMYERASSTTFKTKAWLVVVNAITQRSPMLYSFQGALPRLPLPSLDDTLPKHLRSLRPLLNDEQYAEMERLTAEFRATIAPKLQRYLTLKTWFSSNYVSDWWEEYVYLRGRNPIMVNSNFYGIDTLLLRPTTVQAARAANLTAAILDFRRLLDRQELRPIMLAGVPLCSQQYERMFNTCRVPGVETDVIRHWTDSQHVAVYNRSCWFKVPIHNGRRVLTPAELEFQYQSILNGDFEPDVGEAHLAALTAGKRVPWAEARKKYFRSGVNKASLDSIERAAFVLVLDEQEVDYSADDSEKLDKWSHVMLHGQAHDRWFDKSFNIIVCKNARGGLNAEHSWADAPVMGHLWEWAMIQETRTFGYTESGHTLGTVEQKPPPVQKLRWEISPECEAVIEDSLSCAKQLMNDVEMRLLVFQKYGKGFMKKAKVSPDGFLQMALQLANYRDQGKFCLTYEASMTRLFREGRTETVRSATVESSAFVRAMDDPASTNQERIKLLRKACDLHQTAYRDAMCGKGVDRHLFALYVVLKYLELDSPFLSKVISEPWRLSTSQTPHQQTDLLDLNKHPKHISAGGGFGPVADDGYGVSYIVAGDHTVSFHISSKKSCPTTSSERFRENIFKALSDMQLMFGEGMETNGNIKEKVA